MAIAAQRTHEVMGNESARIPLIIGVSGHRDVRDEDVEKLETAVDGVFADLAKRFPNTPITLVSQLAEGADRLAARVAMKRGMQIVSLLPMSRALYATDFHTDSSKEEFEGMLKKAKRVVEVPLSSGVSEEDIKPDGPARDRCYAAAGVALNHAVHLLMAMWDGQKAAGFGGTGDVVQFMLEGPVPELRNVDDFLRMSGVGPVVHIWTPRKRGTGGEHAAGTTRWIAPRISRWEHVEKEFTRQIGLIERFNADVASLELSPRAPAEDNSLLPCDATCNAAKTAQAHQIELYYRTADVLARQLQRRAKRAYQATSIAGLLALSFYELNTHYHTHRPLFLLMFVLSMLGSILVYVVVRKTATHERFLDYRSLAEALRVQFFWLIGGTSATAIEHLVPRLRDELQWLNLALKGCTGGPMVSSVLVDDVAAVDALRCVQQYWVRKERDYFEQRSRKRRGQVEWHSAYKTSLVVAGLVLVAMTFVLKGAHSPQEQEAMTWMQVGTGVAFILAMSAGTAAAVIGLKRLLLKRKKGPATSFARVAGRGAFGGIGVVVALTALVMLLRAELAVQSAAFLTSAILSVLFTVAAGVLELYGEHFAFAQHLRRYRTMADLFSRADEALAPLLDRANVSESRRLVIELGQEALAENAEWLAMHRERPIRLLRPG